MYSQISIYKLLQKTNIVNILEQLNISQLRNLWLRSPDERLACWRNFRIELASAYAECEEDDARLVSCLESISTWWEQCPVVSVAIDPYDSKKWPTVWEIIAEGECCKYSRGLAMSYNMHFMDKDKTVTLDRVHDHKYNDEYMIANFDGKYGLNSQHGQVINLSNVNYLEVRESFNVNWQLLQNQ